MDKGEFMNTPEELCPHTHTTQPIPLCSSDREVCATLFLLQTMLAQFRALIETKGKMCAQKLSPGFFGFLWYILAGGRTEVTIPQRCFYGAEVQGCAQIICTVNGVQEHLQESP